MGVRTYLLIVKIYYKRSIVFLRFFSPRAQYDKIVASTHLVPKL